MRHPIRRVLPAVAALTLAGSLAACGQDDAPVDLSTIEPSPSPSESLSKEDLAKQKDVDAAWDTLQEYLALENEVTNDGFKNSDKLAPYLGTGPIAEDVIGGNERLADLKYTSEGAIKYSLLDDSDYVAREGGSTQVALKTCVDTTSSRIYNADGDRVDSKTPDRYVTIFSMRSTDDSFWRLVKREYKNETSC